MEVKILSGTNKIGGCITEISSVSGTRIIIDYGTDLKSNDVKDIEGLTFEASKYDAVFITHSHGDHIGLIDFINDDIPVYVEKVSKGIHNITSDFVHDYVKINKSTISFEFEKGILVKDLKITPYIIDHSSYNSCMFLIEGDGKRIVHTGDYRSHGRKGKLFEKLLNKIGQIDLLITEGTALTRKKEKFKTEDELVEELIQKTKDYNQVFVLQSSTNIDRIVSMYKVATRCKKIFIEDLFSSIIAMSISRNIPNPVSFKNVYVWIPSLYYSNQRLYENYIKMMEKYKNYNYNRAYFMLVKTSMFRDIKNKLYNSGYINNACLIYSMWDGYKKDDNTKNFLDKMNSLGVDIIIVHTSGHADLETMKKINDILCPKNTIVIHTEDNNKANGIFNGIIKLNDGESFILD